MATPAPVLMRSEPVRSLRLVKAMVRAEERATSSIPRKAALLAATAILGLGMLLLLVARGNEGTSPDQAWFWTPEWLAGEMEAESDIIAGRTTRQDSDEEFEQALLARTKP